MTELLITLLVPLPMIGLVWLLLEAPLQQRAGEPAGSGNPTRPRGRTPSHLKPPPPPGPSSWSGARRHSRFGRPYPAGPQDASHDHPAHLTAGITGGWLTPNHVRALEGLPPDDDGLTAEEFTR